VRINLSIIITFLICAISCQIDKPKINSVEVNKKAVLLEMIDDLIPGENCKYSISKNKENFAIACPIDSSIQRKSWKWRINLYDNDGHTIGTVEPEDLNDELFIPLGNDTSLLIIFPVGTSDFLRIKFYNLKQERFELSKTIKKESNIYLFDHDYSGNFICYGMSIPSKNEKTNLINYCNSRGNVIWSKHFYNDYPYDVKVSKANNYIFLAIRSIDNKPDIGMILSNEGDKLIDFELPDIRLGNFKMCTSNDDTEEDLVIYSSNFMIHLDNNATNIRTTHIEYRSNIYFDDCFLNQDGSIQITGYKHERDSIGKRNIIDTINYDF
jgi:hypothetical protein